LSFESGSLLKKLTRGLVRIPATLHEIIKEIFSLFEAQLSLGSSEGREVRGKHFLGDGGKERAWDERHPAKETPPQ